MKKWIVCVLLAMGLAGLFSACGNDEEEQTQSAPVSSSEELSAAPEKSADAPAEESKATLVAVFSWANNADLPEDVDIVSSATLNKNASGALVGDTQLMGQTAAQVTGGDYFEILCETKYPGDEDKTYEQAQQEQLDQARPQLASHVENMDDYGTIILVYPNWWGGLPMPVASFLEEYDLSKKTIIPVCCYEAEDSGAATSRRDLLAVRCVCGDGLQSARQCGGDFRHGDGFHELAGRAAGELLMDYELIFADRRSIRLQLRDDGSLLVRAPRWMSRREVDAFVASKERWICEKRAILARGNRDWGGAALSPEELAQLRKAAQVDLGARLEKWSARLGVHPTKLTIRTQHARWGSCSSRGAISLNALLLLAPETVRDYVVVHELCHIKEMNHSRRFWAEVARILPNYAESRDWLKNNGHALLQRNPRS